MAGGARQHTVRIVGGRWKRTPLPVPDVAGLRPTPDRVRETLFNWLGPDLSGLACLDLFAGTGALGLEAASRGAAAVWLVESDRRAARSIAQAIERLDAAGAATLVVGDALATLDRARASGRRFDVVFLDPPFGQGWLQRVLPRLRDVLVPGARIYVESESALRQHDVEGTLGPGWEIARAGRAGQVFYHLLRETLSREGET